MPIGEFIGEAVAQIVMEAGGEAIHSQYGWKGCVIALSLVIAAVAFAIWLLTR
jgi:hypothetical protein